jgi:hypothetical protein
VNPAKFKAPYLSKEEIEASATQIRSQYKSAQKIPIDILAFAEFDLGLEFDFAPIQQLKQDAFLRPDLTGIWFDGTVFKEASLQRRLRFSVAHELAHLFLHKDIYGSINFGTVKQWIAFINAIPAAEYYWIEWQADEFAGRFLMPTKDLSAALDEAVADAEREGFFIQGKEEVLDFCCRALHGHFGISRQAMQTRIRKSGLWPHPKVAKLST